MAIKAQKLNQNNKEIAIILDVVSTEFYEYI